VRCGRSAVARDCSGNIGRSSCSSSRNISRRSWSVLSREIFDEYRSLNRGDQRGKFITIYTRSLIDRDRVNTAIDPELLRYRQVLGVRPGPQVIDRITRTPERPLGVSGFLTWRMYGPGND
jgi:hypothetical protein